MAKRKTRNVGGCHTIGELIASLKKNFDPEDCISILVLFTIDKDAELDLERSSTKDGKSHINNVSWTIESIDKFRKNKD